MLVILILKELIYYNKSFKPIYNSALPFFFRSISFFNLDNMIRYYFLWKFDFLKEIFFY